MFIHTELKRNKQWVFEIFEVKTEINDHPVKNDFQLKTNKFFIKVLLKKVQILAVIQFYYMN